MASTVDTIPMDLITYLAAPAVVITLVLFIIWDAKQKGGYV